MALFGGVVPIAVYWLSVMEPVRRHVRFCREVRAELETLAKKRPENVSRDQ